MEITVPIGKRNVTLLAVNVENEFVGITLTEREGFTMHRVGIELREREDINRLREFLDQQLLLLKDRLPAASLAAPPD